MRWLLWLLAGLAACGGAKTEPAAAPQAAEVQKSTDPAAYAAVAEAFAKKRPNVSQCFANAVASKELGENAKGRIRLALMVLPSGRPENVRVADSSLGSKTVEDCVVATVQKFTLPAPAQPLDFVFTYEFSSL